MKDINGTEITVSSRIAYPGHCGSCLWMNRAVVTDFGEIESWRGNSAPTIKAVHFLGQNDDGADNVGSNKITIHRINNVVVIPNT